MGSRRSSSRFKQGTSLVNVPENWEPQEGWHACLRVYGDGYAEVGWAMMRGSDRPFVKKGESEHKEQNKDRALRRAKTNMRRKIMAMGADHMLTLTYRANQTDLDLAWQHFERFIRGMHRLFPLWQYVVIPERQKRGAIHFHLAVCGFQQVRVIRRLWRSIVGEGNIDVRGPRRRAGQTWALHKLAAYLTKYLGKDLDGEETFNRRRFRSSLHIHYRMVRWMFQGDADRVQEQVLEWLNQVAGRVGYVWDEEDFRGWACSWGGDLE